MNYFIAVGFGCSATVGEIRSTSTLSCVQSSRASCMSSIHQQGLLHGGQGFFLGGVEGEPLEDFVPPPRPFFEKKQIKYMYTAIRLGFLFQMSITLSIMLCGSFSGISNIYVHIH